MHKHQIVAGVVDVEYSSRANTVDVFYGAGSATCTGAVIFDDGTGCWDNALAIQVCAVAKIHQRERNSFQIPLNLDI